MALRRTCVPNGGMGAWGTRERAIHESVMASEEFRHGRRRNVHCGDRRCSFDIAPDPVSEVENDSRGYAIELIAIARTADWICESH